MCPTEAISGSPAVKASLIAIAHWITATGQRQHWPAASGVRFTARHNRFILEVGTAEGLAVNRGHRQRSLS
jgi:hypothetical protein